MPTPLPTMASRAWRRRWCFAWQEARAAAAAGSEGVRPQQRQQQQHRHRRGAVVMVRVRVRVRAGEEESLRYLFFSPKKRIKEYKEYKSSEGVRVRVRVRAGEEESLRSRRRTTRPRPWHPLPPCVPAQVPEVIAKIHNATRTIPTQTSPTSRRRREGRQASRSRRSRRSRRADGILSRRPLGGHAHLVGTGSFRATRSPRDGFKLRDRTYTVTSCRDAGSF